MRRGGGCFGGLGLLALGWGDFLMHTQANLSFDSHNAMARVAMFCGIPLFPLIFLVIGAAVGLFSGVYFFGWWGLGFSFPFLGGICGMRMLCSRDDKAIRRYFFHRKRQRLNKAYGRHLVITPRTLQWREKYVRRLVKKNLLAGAS